MWSALYLKSFFVKTETSKEQHLFEIYIFCNIKCLYFNNNFWMVVYINLILPIYQLWDITGESLTRTINNTNKNYDLNDAICKSLYKY